MNKTLKALVLAFLGLIIWTGLVYIAFAFLKAEVNPFIWEQSTRGGMLVFILCYIAFTPVITMAIKDEM